ncbi:ABC transporter permease [Virgibacillus siamensis]|uniref:ABC transporter permease n=1 Tax=Virgibacillus siamensis TaxID=480071 RepID=UPI0009841F60|nr:ABC transporter permease subunit [Virgibacillus siamensis]
MIKELFKKPLFVIGFSYIALLFLASMIHWFYGAPVPEYDLLYEDHKLTGAAPHSPSELPPLGSDRFGKDYLYLLLKGAKMTIGFAFVAAVLRMIFSTGIGLFYAFFLKRANKFITGLTEAFQYLPTALLAYVILKPVLIQDEFTRTFTEGFWERMVFELLIFVIIALPTISVLIGNETKMILEREFITGARVIGAGRWHTLKKHVMPHLAPKLWINFGQQVIQVLVLLVHLGLLKLFLGGTLKHHLMDNGFESLTAEWSGLIGYSYAYLDIQPWLPLVPLGAFAITILAMNYMIEGMKQALIKDTRVRKLRKDAILIERKATPELTKADFEKVS